MNKNSRDKLPHLWYNLTVDRKIAHQILKLLASRYPDAACELSYLSVFELLVAVILSAQCTDKRVNLVTDKLFKVASSPTDFLLMSQEELEKWIYPCGFFRQKARSIRSVSKDILEKHGGEVPGDFDALIALDGVGRKTANVVLSVAFGQNNLAVDTHVFRVSRRLGLSNGKNPYEVEKDLVALLQDGEFAQAHHLLIFHGRYCCKSQNPDCGKCPVISYCTVPKL